VAVVGGGDSAAEEAVYLTKYCSHVHLLVRGPAMRASKAMADRVLDNPRITVHFNTSPLDAYGEGKLAGLKLAVGGGGAGEPPKHVDLPVAGLFYGIGHTPNSGLIAGQVELEASGYVKVGPGVATSVPGVFAAGDLHDHEWRQAITAAGSGCMAALSAERFLTLNGLVTERRAAAADGGADAGGAAAAAAPAHAGQPEAAHATQHAASTAAAAAAAEPAEDAFDLSQDRHRGQYALRRLYHESDRPICVLYTSPSCGPCRTLKPIFGGVMAEFAGRVHWVEIDIEADAEIAEAAGVAGTPTVQVFKDKERIHSVAGVKTKNDYRGMVSGALAPAQQTVNA